MYVQYIPVYQAVYSTLAVHTPYILCAIACLKESKDSPKLPLPNTNQPLTYYYTQQPEQSCPAVQPSGRRRSPRSVAQVAPSPVAKSTQNEAKPNRIPTETMRTRSTSRAVQGPSDIQSRIRPPPSPSPAPSITPRTEEILQGGGSARQIFERAPGTRRSMKARKPVPSAVLVLEWCRGTFRRGVRVSKGYFHACD